MSLIELKTFESEVKENVPVYTDPDGKQYCVDVKFKTYCWYNTEDENAYYDIALLIKKSKDEGISISHYCYPAIKWVNGNILVDYNNNKAFYFRYSSLSYSSFTVVGTHTSKHPDCGSVILGNYELRPLKICADGNDYYGYSGKEESVVPEWMDLIFVPDYENPDKDNIRISVPFCYDTVLQYIPWIEYEKPFIIGAQVVFKYKLKTPYPVSGTLCIGRRVSGDNEVVTFKKTHELTLDNQESGAYTVRLPASTMDVGDTHLDDYYVYMPDLEYKTEKVFGDNEVISEWEANSLSSNFTRYNGLKCAYTNSPVVLIPRSESYHWSSYNKRFHCCLATKFNFNDEDYDYSFNLINQQDFSEFGSYYCFELYNLSNDQYGEPRKIPIYFDVYPFFSDLLYGDFDIGFIEEDGTLNARIEPGDIRIETSADPMQYKTLVFYVTVEGQGKLYIRIKPTKRAAEVFKTEASIIAYTTVDSLPMSIDKKKCYEGDKCYVKVDTPLYPTIGSAYRDIGATIIDGEDSIAFHVGIGYPNGNIMIIDCKKIGSASVNYYITDYDGTEISGILNIEIVPKPDYKLFDENSNKYFQKYIPIDTYQYIENDLFNVVEKLRFLDNGLDRFDEYIDITDGYFLSSDELYEQIYILEKRIKYTSDYLRSAIKWDGILCGIPQEKKDKINELINSITILDSVDIIKNVLDKHQFIYDRLIWCNKALELVNEKNYG